ncbi:hypothetical protein GF361_02485 [Candidatus Woesearchaeota archaeon]|nr:hypothetical protein [Candidatus Woesearchaeota archaeon]
MNKRGFRNMYELLSKLDIQGVYEKNMSFLRVRHDNLEDELAKIDEKGDEYYKHVKKQYKICERAMHHFAKHGNECIKDAKVRAHMSVFPSKSGYGFERETFSQDEYKNIDDVLITLDPFADSQDENIERLSLMWLYCDEHKGSRHREIKDLCIEVIDMLNESGEKHIIKAYKKNFGEDVFYFCKALEEKYNE